MGFRIREAPAQQQQDKRRRGSRSGSRTKPSALVDITNRDRPFCRRPSRTRAVDEDFDAEVCTDADVDADADADPLACDPDPSGERRGKPRSTTTTSKSTSASSSLLLSPKNITTRRRRRKAAAAAAAATPRGSSCSRGSSCVDGLRGREKEKVRQQNSPHEQPQEQSQEQPQEQQQEQPQDQPQEQHQEQRQQQRQQQQQQQQQQKLQHQQTQDRKKHPAKEAAFSASPSTGAECLWSPPATAANDMPPPSDELTGRILRHRSGRGPPDARAFFHRCRQPCEGAPQPHKRERGRDGTRTKGNRRHSLSDGTPVYSSLPVSTKETIAENETDTENVQLLFVDRSSIGPLASSSRPAGTRSDSTESYRSSNHNTNTNTNTNVNNCPFAHVIHGGDRDNDSAIEDRIRRCGAGDGWWCTDENENENETKNPIVAEGCIEHDSKQMCSRRRILPASCDSSSSPWDHRRRSPPSTPLAAETATNQAGIHGDAPAHNPAGSSKRKRSGGESPGIEPHAGGPFTGNGNDAGSSSRRRRKNNSDKDGCVLFKDIIGHQSAKLRLDEVLLPLALPATISEHILRGIRSLPASILFYGPPGCGKASNSCCLGLTQLARALAGEARGAFLSIGPGDILSKYVGESEAAVRSVFAEALRMARDHGARRGGNPCTVLFFDEIDALGLSRGSQCGGGSGSRGGPMPGGSGAYGDNPSRRVLAELLLQLNRVDASCVDPGSPGDGIESGEEDAEDNQSSFSSSPGREGNDPFPDADSDWTMVHRENNGVGNPYQAEPPGEKSPIRDPAPRIIVVAATNRPGDCDPALVRRFAIQVPVGLPTQRDRTKMLRTHVGDIYHTLTERHFSELSLATEGWSGSDLQRLSREAAMAPVRECIRRAALMKRRNQLAAGRRCPSAPPFVQGEGLPSQQRPSGSSGSLLPRACPRRQQLLEEFRNLRPVGLGDYRRALALWFGGACESLHGFPTAGPKETGSGSGRSAGGGCRIEHYDSSSDEESTGDGDPQDEGDCHPCS